MKITIFNASESESQEELNSYTEDLAEKLSEHHEVKIINLREQNIHYCNGCWGCWVKTPGECVIKDDIVKILFPFIHSNLVIFAAPMKMGFPSSLMKKVNDRLIPLVHPYITLVDNECHHLARYTSYPKWGLILEEEAGGLESDIETVHSIYSRTALNIKSELKFTTTINQPAKELAHEINTI